MSKLIPGSGDTLKTGSIVLTPRISGRRRATIGLFVLAAMLTMLALGERGFHTNDDPTMASFASGGFTGTPNARWVFVDPIVSVTVTWLYQLNAALPWYGLAYYLIHAVAVVVLVDVLWRRFHEIGRATGIVGIATIAAVEPRFLLSLSFTTTAFMASLAAAVLFAEGFDVIFLSRN